MKIKQYIKERSGKGFWFCCNDDQLPAIRELIEEKFFKPLTDLYPCVSASYWLIPYNYQKDDIKEFFSPTFIEKMNDEVEKINKKAPKA